MFNVSVMLGWFSGIQEWFEGLFGGFVNAIIGVFWFYIYSIFAAIATVVEILQSLFMQLAGMGKNQAGEFVDFATQALTSDAILRVFRNLALVAIALIIIFSIVAIVKSEWAQDGKASKAKVVGQALKSILLFMLIPSLSVGGIFLSNALLRTLSKAISTNQDMSIGGQVFLSAAYNANRARYSGTLGSADVDFVDENFYSKISDTNPNSYNFGVFGTSNSGVFKNKTVIADQIDWAVTNSLSGTDVNFNGNYSISLWENSQCALTCPVAPHKNSFNYLNPMVVNYFYNISKINVFVLFGGIFAIAYFMLIAIIGLTKRILMIAALFAVSPPIIAMMPLDNGSAFGSWKKEYIGYILGAYGTVLGMNLLFVLLQLTDSFVFSLTIFGLTYDSILATLIMRVLFLIVGLIMINKDLPTLISGFVGGKNAYSDGKDMSGDVVKMAAKGASVAAGVGGAALKLGGPAFRGVSALGNKITHNKEGDKNWLGNATSKVGSGVGKAGGTIKHAAHKITRATGLDTAFGALTSGLTKSENYKELSGLLRKGGVFDIFKEASGKKDSSTIKDIQKYLASGDLEKMKNEQLDETNKTYESGIASAAATKNSKLQTLDSDYQKAMAETNKITLPSVQKDEQDALTAKYNNDKASIESEYTAEENKLNNVREKSRNNIENDYQRKLDNATKAIKYIKVEGEAKIEKAVLNGDSGAATAQNVIKDVRKQKDAEKLQQQQDEGLLNDMQRSPSAYGLDDVNSRELIDALKTAFKEGTIKTDSDGNVTPDSIKQALNATRSNLDSSSLMKLTNSINASRNVQEDILKATKDKNAMKSRSNEENLAKAIKDLTDKIDKMGNPKK